MGEACVTLNTFKKKYCIHFMLDPKEAAKITGNRHIYHLTTDRGLALELSQYVWSSKSKEMSHLIGQVTPNSYNF